MLRSNFRVFYKSLRRHLTLERSTKQIAMSGYLWMISIHRHVPTMILIFPTGILRCFYDSIYSWLWTVSRERLVSWQVTFNLRFLRVVKRLNDNFSKVIFSLLFISLMHKKKFLRLRCFCVRFHTREFAYWLLQKVGLSGSNWSRKFMLINFTLFDCTQQKFFADFSSAKRGKRGKAKFFTVDFTFSREVDKYCWIDFKPVFIVANLIKGWLEQS